MGCLFNFKKSNTAVPNVLLASTLKKAKSPEQCKCIDFFLDVAATKGKKGCGCLKKNSEWTVDDYIAYVDDFVAGLDLRQRAITKIGLAESQISEITPIVLSSFVRRGDNIYWKTNENGTKYVTNKFSVTWIFFSPTQIYTHTYIFDTMSDNTEESTSEFFYSDITCIRTCQEVEEVVYTTNLAAGCGCLKETESSDARYHRKWYNLQITVPNDSYSFACRATDTLEESVQAAKAMIRQKKLG